MDEATFFFGGWKPVVRVVVAGAFAYVALIPLLRASGKRTRARMNGFDLVLVVAVGAVNPRHAQGLLSPVRRRAQSTHTGPAERTREIRACVHRGACHR